MRCCLVLGRWGISYPLWRQTDFHNGHAHPCVFCSQGDSCICMQCAWTAWKGFTRSSASNVSRGGTAAGTSLAPCIPMTSWPPLPAVRWVPAPLRSSRWMQRS
jgi:hypothetical protein